MPLAPAYTTAQPIRVRTRHRRSVSMRPHCSTLRMCRSREAVTDAVVARVCDIHAAGLIDRNAFRKTEKCGRTRTICIAGCPRLARDCEDVAGWQNLTDRVAIGDKHRTGRVDCDVPRHVEPCTAPVSVCGAVRFRDARKRSDDTRWRDLANRVVERVRYKHVAGGIDGEIARTIKSC